MKTLVLLLFTVATFGQIKVSESKNEKIGNIGLFFELKHFNNDYILTYTDLNYNQITNVKSIVINSGDIEAFYSLILDNFDSPKYLDMELKDSLLKLNYVKNFGIVSLQIIATDKLTNISGKSSYITKKQWIKLFGKN